MNSLAADVRFAARVMRANPGFTAIAVAALALGIGANTAIFTVVNHVLLQPLPYPEPDRIVKVGRWFGGNNYGFSTSIPKYMVWRANQVVEMTLYGQAAIGVPVGSGDRPEQAKESRVSEGYFRVFGLKPALGRTFTPQEDLPNGPDLTVLSYGFWQARLGGDRSILGRAITVDGKPVTVIGILPRNALPDPPADFWMPLQADPESTNQGHYLAAAGRLKPGVTLERAQAEMKVVGERFRTLHPGWIMGKTESVALMPMREAIVGDVKTPLLILLGAVAFVLLIACANVANLLLARAAARQKELAVRVAMGARRGRMVRQLLTESLLLALMGGALGLALGAWGVRALLLAAPGNIPRLTDPNTMQAALPALDWRVAGFTLALAMLTAVIFGLVPALHTSNPDLASTLKEAGGRSGSSRAQNRLRSVLVVAEVALALVLLVGASLMIRTFAGLRSADPGIDPRDVLTLETYLGSSYSSVPAFDRLVTEGTRRLESVPGVEAAAAMVALPLTNEIDLPFSIAGRPDPKGSPYNGDVQWRSVSPHYFRVFRVPLVRGRVFTETDVPNSAPVVLINQKTAARFWPKEDPIGQVITIGKGLGAFDEPPRQIIGVVGNIRETGMREGETPVLYVPESQVQKHILELINSALPLSWAVRTAADPAGLRAPIEAEIRTLDRRLVASHVRPMEQVIAQTLARQNFNMVLLTVFAGVALLLAAIGIYGLMAYSVERRTQEIGIRLALGAAEGDVVKMVLAQGGKLAGAGLVLGLAIAYALTRMLSSLLFGVRASDPVSFAATAAVLAGVALAASYVPARRAARVEASSALRCD